MVISLQVNYHRRKVQYLKKTSQLLLERYGGHVPDRLSELMELPGAADAAAWALNRDVSNRPPPPGVGEKTALLYLQVAKGKACRGRASEPSRLLLTLVPGGGHSCGHSRAQNCERPWLDGGAN